ncbi:MAG: hypothetical protein M3P06_11500 [Acidobacteriota bacterium]|nr:hypothetical protein [Acidobacteriota bacterium]
MTVSNTLVIKIILAAVACIFTWFLVGEFSVEDTAQLLGVGVVGFALAAVILP